MTGILLCGCGQKKAPVSVEEEGSNVTAAVSVPEEPEITAAPETPDIPQSMEPAKDIDVLLAVYQQMPQIFAMKETGENSYENNGFTVSWEITAYFPDSPLFMISNESNPEIEFCGMKLGDDYGEFVSRMPAHDWIRMFEREDSSIWGKYIDDIPYVLYASDTDGKLASWSISNEIYDGSLYVQLDKVAILQKNRDLAEWKRAYISALADNYTETVYDQEFPVDEYSYWLVRLDDDEIPELLVGYTPEYRGQDLYFVDGLDYGHLAIGGSLSYMEGENRFSDVTGRMHIYDDVVYQLDKGQAKEVIRGHYGAEDNTDVQFDENGPVYVYQADGKTVTKEEYAQLVFDHDRGQWPDYDQAVSEYYEMMQRIIAY